MTLTRGEKGSHFFLKSEIKLTFTKIRKSSTSLGPRSNFAKDKTRHEKTRQDMKRQDKTRHKILLFNFTIQIGLIHINNSLNMDVLNMDESGKS